MQVTVCWEVGAVQSDVPEVRAASIKRAVTAALIMEVQHVVLRRPQSVP